jgi:excisionase family DNA binding protein
VLSMSDERLLSVAEVAKMLGLAVGSVRNMTYKRELPHVKIGHAVRYREGAILKWIAAREVAERRLRA